MDRHYLLLRLLIVAVMDRRYLLLRLLLLLVLMLLLLSSHPVRCFHSVGPVVFVIDRSECCCH